MSRQHLHDVQEHEIAAAALESLREIGAQVAGVQIEHRRTVVVDVLIDRVDRVHQRDVAVLRSTDLDDVEFRVADGGSPS